MDSTRSPKLTSRPASSAIFSKSSHQFFFAEFLEVEFSGQWQREWRGHDQFSARKVGNRSTETILFHRDKSQIVFECREAGRKAGRPATDDEKIEDVGLSDAPQFAYGATA